MTLSFNDYNILRQMQEACPNVFRIVDGDVVFNENEEDSQSNQSKYQIIKIFGPNQYQFLSKVGTEVINWAGNWPMLFDSFEKAESYFVKQILPKLDRAFFTKNIIAVMSNGEIFDRFDPRKGSFSKVPPVKSDFRAIQNLWPKLQNQQVRQRFYSWVNKNFKPNKQS